MFHSNTWQTVNKVCILNKPIHLDRRWAGKEKNLSNMSILKIGHCWNPTVDWPKHPSVLPTEKSMWTVYFKPVCLYLKKAWYPSLCMSPRGKGWICLAKLGPTKKKKDWNFPYFLLCEANLPFCHRFLNQVNFSCDIVHSAQETREFFCLIWIQVPQKCKFPTASRAFWNPPWLCSAHPFPHLYNATTFGHFLFRLWKILKTQRKG